MREWVHAGLKRINSTFDQLTVVSMCTVRIIRSSALHFCQYQNKKSTVANHPFRFEAIHIDFMRKHLLQFSNRKKIATNARYSREREKMHPNERLCLNPLPGLANNQHSLIVLIIVHWIAQCVYIISQLFQSLSIYANVPVVSRMTRCMAHSKTVLADRKRKRQNGGDTRWMPILLFMLGNYRNKYIAYWHE